jgi:transposase-like protein
MTRPRKTDDTTCQNLHCKYHQKEKDKNIIKHGKNRAGHQIYKCQHCNTYFTQTKNTPLYRKHLTEQQITNICKHLVEKNGIRSIERLTGHHRDTIGNLLEDMAEHAAEVSEYFMKDLGLSQFECDEIWTFIKKKKRRLSELARLNLKAATATYTPL